MPMTPKFSGKIVIAGKQPPPGMSTGQLVASNALMRTPAGIASPCRNSP